MSSQETINCEKLRDSFEGHETIYIEKGVLRVRVENIRWNAGTSRIDAEVEEVPTPGLKPLLFPNNELSPLRWSIGAGYRTTFSKTTWEMGYGGWSLFFSPEIISGLISIASTWNHELNAADRYNDALHYLRNQGAYEKSERVFFD